MTKNTKITLFVLAAIAAGLWMGCSTAPTGNFYANRPPETFIVNVPPGSDTLNAIAVVYWYGRDADGVVAYYEWFISGEFIEPSQITEWDSIFATNDTMKLTIEDLPDSLIVLDTVIDTTIVGPDTFYKVREIWNFSGYFYVRAVDDKEVRDLTPAYRGWNVFSEKPVIEIAAPDNSSGMVKYFVDNRPEFWNKTDVPVMFYIDQTTPLWQGLHIWWSRKDTLNKEWNKVIGYRFRIDSDPTWTSWTDLDSSTANDSFLIVNKTTIPNNVSLTDGTHILYLQGRNASLVESNIDSIVFRTINPRTNTGDIIVLFSTNQTWSLLSWYQGLFGVIRPNATVRYINRSTGVLQKDSLVNASLVIYVRDDQFTTVAAMSKDTLALIDYINTGGRFWTFGLNLISSMSDTTGLGGSLIRDYLGIDYYNNCGSSEAMGGVAPTSHSAPWNIPQDTLLVEQTHAFPNSQMLKYGENFPTSDPFVTVVYSWIGNRPYSETPVGIFYNNPSLGIKSASFGFSGRSMQWDANTYEPIASLYDAVLQWFGL